jgi:predicted RNA-binding Zn-ribbon protein involved in translation (DUF1610 family)
MNIRQIIREELDKVLSEDIICKNCKWSWEIEKDDKNPYLCHKCGFDNSQNKFDYVEKL